MRILFTCGGTAGHINPALGVAGRIRQLMPDAQILFVGAKGKMETELVPAEGFEIKTVEITNLSRGFTPAQIGHNLKTVKNVVTARFAAARIIRDFKPDIAVGTGGYVCYPVLAAASAQGIPTLIHESNAVPGLTTRLLERRVTRILTGFSGSEKNYRRPDRVVFTGTPVRTGFTVTDKNRAKAALGVSRDKPLVVSVWGSLGASHMNETVARLIEIAPKEPPFYMIHSAGKRDYAGLIRRLRESAPDYEARGFDAREYIYDMSAVMSAADLVMCRAGASTLGELSALGKPAILVPSPNVTGGHQEKNARILEAAGAAKVLIEGEFTAESLLGEISALLGDEDKLSAMSEAMRALGVPDATDRIVGMLLELCSCR